MNRLLMFLMVLALTGCHPAAKAEESGHEGAHLAVWEEAQGRGDVWELKLGYSSEYPKCNPIEDISDE